MPFVTVAVAVTVAVSQRTLCARYINDPLATPVCTGNPVLDANWEKLLDESMAEHLDLTSPEHGCKEDEKGGRKEEENFTWRDVGCRGGGRGRRRFALPHPQEADRCGGVCVDGQIC